MTVMEGSMSPSIAWKRAEMAMTRMGKELEKLARTRNRDGRRNPPSRFTPYPSSSSTRRSNNYYCPGSLWLGISREAPGEQRHGVD